MDPSRRDVVLPSITSPPCHDVRALTSQRQGVATDEESPPCRDVMLARRDVSSGPMICSRPMD